MARPVPSSITKTSGSASACAITMPTHEAGDLLVCCIEHNGTGTYSSATAGWANESGSAVNSNHNSNVLTKVAASGSETLTVTYSASAGFQAYCFVVKGHHATPIIGSARVAHASGKSGNSAGALSLGGYDNSLVIYFGAANSGSVTFQRFGLDESNPLASDYRFDYAGAHIAFRQMGAYADANNAPVVGHYWDATATATVWTLAIRDAGTGDLAPYTDLNMEEIAWYGGFGSKLGTITPDTPDKFAGVGVAINGITVDTATTTPTTLGDTWGSTSVLSNSTNYGGERLVGFYHTLSFPALAAGNLISLEFDPLQANTTQFGAGGGGYLFGLKDNGGNWILWKLGHPAITSSAVWQRVFIELGNADTIWAYSGASAAATLAAMNWANLVGAAWMMDRANGTTSATSMNFKNLFAHTGKATISGGCAARPASFNELQTVAAAYAMREIMTLQGTRQILSRIAAQIGNDGAIPMYFSASAAALEFPESYVATAFSDRQKWRVSQDKVGITLLPGDGDTLDLSAGVLNANQRAVLTVDAGASATATCTFSGESAIGFKASLTPNVLFAGMTLKGGEINLAAAGTYEFIVAESVVMNFTPTAPGTYVMGDCSITGTLDLRNTTAHAITVELPSGTSTTTANNTGGTITVTTPTSNITFAGMVAGGTLKVFTTGTQTELFSDTNAATSEVWTGASGTFDYTWIKEGYTPIRATGEVVSGSRTITLQPSVDRAYVASSGIAWADVTVDTLGKLLKCNVATTGQNLYSFLVESWRSQSTLQNKAFPLAPNGPNSFSLLDGWETRGFTTAGTGIANTTLSNLSRDGLRYVSAAGATSAQWAAILSTGVPTGKQVRYQRINGGPTINAASTGNIDQLVQVYGDATHGNFDYRGHLDLKLQATGYDEAAVDAVSMYGNMEDQLFVVGLAPTANGVATGNPALANPPTITDHGASPVTWNSKAWSITITDSAAGNSGEDILRWIRYAQETGGAFQGTDAYNWHDLVRTNGSKFKTVRGEVHASAGAALKGVRVLTNAGDPHLDFDLFTADDGTTYTPPAAAPIAWAGALDGTTVLLYNDSTPGSPIIDTQTITGAGGYLWNISLPHADVAAGDSLRLRFGHKEYYAGELQGTMTATGLTFVGDMTLHPVYAAWGLDGAVYDQGYTPPGPYVMDGTNLQVDIATGSTTGLKTQLGAWTQYLMTLPAGLDAFYGAWDLLAVNQIRQNVSVVDVKIDVPTAGALFTFTDHDVNYYRSDFSYPGNVETGHGLIAITYNASIFVPDPVIVSGESVVTGTPETVADAVRLELTAELADITKARKLAQNKKVLDPATGVQKVFDDDGSTVLGQGNAYMDADGTQLYDGTAPVHRTERLA